MEEYREEKIEDDPNKSYSVYKLFPNQKSKKILLDKDYFNHINYEEREEQNLSKIKAPQIGLRQARSQQQEEEKTIENNDNEELRQSKPQHHRRNLVEQQKIEGVEIKNHYKEINFTHFISGIDLDKLIRENSEQQDQNMKNLGILNKKFDMCCNNNLRKDLQFCFLKAQSLKDGIKKRVQQSSIYSGLHENYFKNKGSLKFAEMQNQLKFIEKSKVNQKFMGLFIGNSKDIHSICEFILYQALNKLEFSPEECLFYTLPIDSEEFIINANDLNKEIQIVKDLDLGQIFINVNELAKMSWNERKLLSLKQIQELDELIDQESDLGFMFYYGGSPLPIKNDQIYYEREYKAHLLQHIIIGLTILQHKVCQKSKQRKPEILKFLKVLYQKYTDNLEKNMELDFLFGDSLIEKQEESFKLSITSQIEGVTVYRKQVISAAIDNEIPDERIIEETKQKYLNFWGIPIQNKKDFQQMARSNHYQKSNNPFQKQPTPLISEEEQLKNIQQGDQAAREYLSTFEKKNNNGKTQNLNRRQQQQKKQEGEIRKKKEEEILKYEEIQRKKKQIEDSLKKRSGPKKKQIDSKEEEKEKVKIDGDKIQISVALKKEEKNDGSYERKRDAKDKKKQIEQNSKIQIPKCTGDNQDAIMKQEEQSKKVQNVPQDKSLIDQNPHQAKRPKLESDQKQQQQQKQESQQNLQQQSQQHKQPQKMEDKIQISKPQNKEQDVIISSKSKEQPKFDHHDNNDHQPHHYQTQQRQKEQKVLAQEEIQKKIQEEKERLKKISEQAGKQVNLDILSKYLAKK